jgi:DNA transformation protein
VTHDIEVAALHAKELAPMQSLRELPNIGDEMDRCLQQAGIRTPEELRRIGSVEAAILVSPHKRSGPVCRSALCALEGAIRGIRWHSIPKAERDELWEQYRHRQEDDS